jgi:hypothetical protein
MLADDDVPGLDIAMKNAPAMCILDGVADVEEPPQQLLQLQDAATGVAPHCHVGVEVVDRLLETVAPDEPHGVIGAAFAVGAQAVHGHDAGVLQAAGDLGLDDEPLTTGRIVCVMVLDLLQGDLAVQLGVERHEHGAQAAACVGPQDEESLAVAGGAADGEGFGLVVLG